MTAKQTPLYDTHLRYGGRMVEFGGWQLPVQYSGIKEEHQSVRTAAGLFDVSHMGEVTVGGREALAFLQKLVTNDVAKLGSNQVLYTPMCYPCGGTVDDLLVYKQEEGSYLLVINAANIEKDWNWMLEVAEGFAVELGNVSDQTAQLALQGPLAAGVLAKLTGAPLDRLSYYRFFPEVDVAGKQVLVSRTGYTGEDGFELYCKPDEAVHLWEALMAAGSPLGLLPCGLGCRDTLRFEVCFPLYGHELSRDISPVEAGIGMFVKLDKGDFIGCNPLREQKERGPKRKIVGFEMLDRGVARGGYSVWVDGSQAGVVTTGSYSPSLNKNLGLALVDAGYAETGKTLAIEIRGKQLAARIIAKPFYKRGGK
ncbi:Aminomethyltransferase [Propionispora sp. 2/2-37]|uniref:glycine cleavage system aminomethyltransferase GcvT n=1 Tax=Propionispora sp. 2/2-37 TaxID=1677858 RepID=UPI0006BB5DC8|nr:glycine cleavage system aminomethyltransferase GcvT [Propionispora sp. 2/2-37]CUH95239.1 Aminomethyltransferase [Propionispora sp. 2/2-37]